MLLINIHELQVILAQSIAFAALEDQIKNIRSILCLDGQDILSLRRTQHFCEGCEVESESNIAIASERGEGFGLEHHGYEGDVGVVHSLEGDTGVIAVEVAVLNQVLDGINDLGKSASLRLSI